MKSLHRTCARHSLLPESLQVELCYDPVAAPHSHGEFADVWKGEHRGLEVAVKVLRTHTNGNLEETTRVSRRRCSPFQFDCQHADCILRRNSARNL